MVVREWQKKGKENDKDGKLDVAETWWSVDRQKSSERNYKDGTLVDNLKTECTRMGRKRRKETTRTARLVRQRCGYLMGKNVQNPKT